MIPQAPATSPLEPMSHPARPQASVKGLLLSLLVLLAMTASGCSDHHHGGRGGAPTQTPCPATSSLTYSSFGRTFMQSYCLRCHSVTVTGAARKNAPADHNFDDAVDIGLFADHIDEYAGSGPAATNVVMPPDDPRPSVAERAQLSEWLACGAP